MDTIHQILDVIQNSKKRNVLATILHVEGTAYLKEGTMMLFHDDGSQVGMISAGCLESDLVIRSEEVFNDGKPRTITYEMNEETDISWGHGTGCNGVLHILLELVNHPLRKNMITLKKSLDRGIPVQHIKMLTDDLKLSDSFYHPLKETMFGKQFVDVPSEILSYLHSEKPSTSQSGIHKFDDYPILLYTHLFSPKPRLVIFGAGPDVQPLVSLAALTGFSITLCDWRTEFCNKKQFPTANQFIVGFPSETIEQLNLTPQDYVVIMTHHFQRDQEILSAIIHQNLRYLGILGPRNRTGKLLNHAAIPLHLHSPIGLSIRAKGPQEIAISIVAELIQCLRSPLPQSKYEWGK